MPIRGAMHACPPHMEARILVNFGLQGVTKKFFKKHLTKILENGVQHVLKAKICTLTRPFKSQAGSDQKSQS